MKRLLRILFVLLALFVVWSMFTGNRGPTVESGSTLVVVIAGSYTEAAEPSFVGRLLGDRSQTFASLLSDLRKAERDDRIATVVFRIRDLQMGWAKIQELRSATRALSDAGRRTVSFLEVSIAGGNREYYLASASDEVFVSPGASANIIGLSADFYFFGGLWEKYGVGVEVEGIGEFKSAGEMLAGRTMSDPHREMANSILDSTHGQFVAGIAAMRGLSEAEVQAAIDAPAATPAGMVERKFVDSVMHWDELLDTFGDAPRIEAEDYAKVDPATLGFEPEKRFALVYGSGNVVMGSGTQSASGGQRLTSDTVSEALEDAADDPAIDAILFRIDSPGGSPLAAEIVWRASQRAKQSGKPLVASFSDVAASGGYYVACAADAILAPPASLVGSIGVFVTRPTLTGLFENLDIGVETLKRGALADLFSPSEPLSDSARELLRREIAGTYELFVQRVADGRGLSIDEVDEVARGRVWTGEQAAELGLIDRVGGLREAVAVARELVGIDPDADVALIPYPPPRTVFEQLAAAMQNFSVAPTPVLPVPKAMRSVHAWFAAVALGIGSPQLLPPFLVEIH